ncbi:hypothetical protein E2P69_21305 [Xanthomonas perforans]|nr:hypothetical protein BJD13_01355 [Xanthomonas perforans]APP82786.1 hypothetical protein BJD10_24210 [Xanthomonas hortorum pv. gardneri]KLA99328.1 hypothetical protein SM19410_06945 [Xanthomonas hortorum pv. gardneri]KLB02809.1 hypothetical protein SM17710_02615 [Xanthomonas hortorum pv. gardneri]KLB06106.1 hypothetical protein SM18210_02085 [Xanthomonas hortorum pv. gardneri]
MDQAGIVCWSCKSGVFMPRGFWQFACCPGCLGSDVFCEFCMGRAYVATPRDDLDVAELGRYWDAVIVRAGQYGEPLPGPIEKLRLDARTT